MKEEQFAFIGKGINDVMDISYDKAVREAMHIVAKNLIPHHPEFTPKIDLTLRELETLLKHAPASLPSAPKEAASGVDIEKVAEDYGEEHGEWITKVHQYFTGEGMRQGFVAGYDYAVSTHASTPPTAKPEAAKAYAAANCDCFIHDGNPEKDCNYSKLEAAFVTGAAYTTNLPASTALNDGWAKGFAVWTSIQGWRAIWDGKFFNRTSNNVVESRSVDDLYSLYLATLPIAPKK